jgi:hypothetical protein
VLALIATAFYVRTGWVQMRGASSSA